MPNKRALILLVVTVVVIGGFFASPSPASATGKEKILWRFSGQDGANPQVGLIFDSAGNLYSATGGGGGGESCGGNGCGVVFQLTPGANGTWSENVLHRFSDVGTDGVIPTSSVLVADGAGNLYGTTYGGGAYRFGTVYEVTQGQHGTWTESVIYNFKGGGDGGLPQAGVAFDSSGNLYGTTPLGGSYGYGTVYELTPDKSGIWKFSVLHSFGSNDVVYPNTVIVDARKNLYGTANKGGAFGQGAVFEVSPAGKGQWNESLLHSFNGNDGASPYANLIFDARGRLYGTTQLGGKYGLGTVFQLTRNQKGKWIERVLHQFQNDGKDGTNPLDTLVFDARGSLYGTTQSGGHGCGIVFQLKPDNSGRWMETVLYSFSCKNKDGQNPIAGPLIFDDIGNLYGTTGGGGNNSCFGNRTCGTVFEIKR